MTQDNKTLAIPGSIVLSQKQAMYLLKTVWPEAPDVEVLKAGIICHQYGLNPLMREVYLIPFGQGKDRTWATILGIRATRKIAKVNHRYTYLDGPRVMSDEEQKKIFGQVETDKIWAITRIREADGSEYPGYGWWSKDKPAYGSDKGNSPRNMAFIRSERNAIDKMAPGELPDVDVTDESFTVANVQKVIAEGKKEFLEQTEREIDELYGPADTDKEATPAPAQAKAEASEAPTGEKAQAKPVRAPATIKTIAELYKACHEDFNLQPKQVLANLNANTQADISDTPANCYITIRGIFQK